MSEVIGYDLDFYPKEPARAGEPWHVMLWERCETGELRKVVKGYGVDDFAALRDLIERLTGDDYPNRSDRGERLREAGADVALSSKGEMVRMSMTAREPFAVWSSVRNVGIVGAVLGGALAVRSWRRTRRTIRLARDSGDQMEVVARMRAVIRHAG